MSFYSVILYAIWGRKEIFKFHELYEYCICESIVISEFYLAFSTNEYF